jgi:predicted  nucleic acid-binding Zn-ribbon protein
MPHQCLKCDRIFDNTSDVIIKGCSDCGNKLFLYVKSIPKERESIEISKEQKKLILKEVESAVGIEDPDMPVILKLENIKILSPGKYEIDINQLMKKEKPVVYKVQDGTYVIDLNYLQDMSHKIKK